MLALDLRVGVSLVSDFGSCVRIATYSVLFGNRHRVGGRAFCWYGMGIVVVGVGVGQGEGKCSAERRSGGCGRA